MRVGQGRVLALIIAVLVLVASGVHGQTGLPDLVIKAVRISPSSVEDGENAQLRAMIVNQGQSDISGSFDVLFELDGRELGALSIFGLRSQQTRELQIPWQAVAGAHELLIVVDAPFNDVRESNESNNKFLLNFAVDLPAGARSFSLNLVRVFAQALDEAGQALTFKMTDSIFTSLDNAMQALQNSATTLRNTSTELQLLRSTVPPLFANQAQYIEADSLVTLFDALAGSLLRIGGALSIGDFDGVLTQAHTLRGGLVQVSEQKLAGTVFTPVQAAISQFDQVIALATELRSLLRGAQGRPQYSVAVDLFNAFTLFGNQLQISAREIIGQAHAKAALFYENGGHRLNGGHAAGQMLMIEMPGALILQFELFDASGTRVYGSNSMDILEWNTTAADGVTLLPAATYFYQLTSICKNGTTGRTELGRLRIVPPAQGQDNP